MDTPHWNLCVFSPKLIKMEFHSKHFKIKELQRNFLFMIFTWYIELENTIGADDQIFIFGDHFYLNLLLSIGLFAGAFLMAYYYLNQDNGSKYVYEELLPVDVEMY